jgi:hypothetical protein
MNYLTEYQTRLRMAVNQYCVLAVETLEHLKTINQPATERERDRERDGNRLLTAWYLTSSSNNRWQYQPAIPWRSLLTRLPSYIIIRAAK